MRNLDDRIGQFNTLGVADVIGLHLCVWIELVRIIMALAVALFV